MFARTCLLLLCLVFIFVQGTAQVITFYVSPKGNDGANGRSSAQAFATIGRAKLAVRQVLHDGKPKSGVRVLLAGGTYAQTQPVVFGLEDSGTEQCPITYTAIPGQSPRISGGRRITGWTVRPDGLWQTQLPEVQAGNWYFRQIWVNGQTRQRARTPNAGFLRVKGLPDGGPEADYQLGGQRFEFAKGDLNSRWMNLTDAEVIVYHFWTDTHLPIQAIDTTTNIVTFKYKAGKRFTDDFTKDGARYIVENVLEALDAPGEWYLNRTSGVLLYHPVAGETPAQTEVIAPVATELLRFEGNAQQRKFVEHIHFDGIAFAHTHFELPPGRVNDRQGSAEVGACIPMRGTRFCSFRNCQLSQLGTFGFELTSGCAYNQFTHNTLSHLAAGGFRMSGGTHQDHPLTRTGWNTLTDNTIEFYGEVYPSAVGILLMHSQGNQVAHNLIHHGYYTGISVGWVWGYTPSISRDNLIEYNHIHHIGQGLLSDMGAIYALGLSPGTVIRNNRIHDIDANHYGGWGIYLDEGSTSVLVENNVVYRTKFAGFNIHYAKEATVRNNIFALSRLNLLNRQRPEPHRSLFFENNILYWTQGTLLAQHWEDTPYSFYTGANKKPKEVEIESTFEADYNLYFNPTQPADSLRFGANNLAEWQKRGKDAHSLYADPLFVDVETENFALKPNSPAFRLGFKPIDLSAVGPRKQQEVGLVKK